MTPRYVFEMLKPYIPKGKMLSDPFHGDGKSAQILRQLGFIVKDHKGQDFFKLRKRDFGSVIVSNPPFSKKQEVLQRLKDLGIPFIVILPTSTISTKFMREIFNGEIQLIIPPTRLCFRREGTSEKSQSSCYFESAFFCWRINLKKDINYIVGRANEKGIMS